MLRYLRRDHPEQGRRAREAFRRAAVGEYVLAIPSVVVAEVVWVLGSVYGVRAPELTATLGSFLASDGLEVEDAAREAVGLMAAFDVDFADGYLAAVARGAGKAVLSFDRDFSRLGVGRV